MATESKISVYSVPDLKNTTDDALTNYFTSLKFKQSHQFTDVRLLLGYSAVIIGGALFYFDWTLGWDKTKAYTLPAVVIYFLLNGAFTYWVYFVEKGAIYMGEKDGVQIAISTSAGKYVPVYNVTVRNTTPQGQWKERKIEAPFMRWFTSDGRFVAKPFQQFLASEIEIVGKADPGNIVEEIGRGQDVSTATTTSSSSKSMNVRIDDLAGVLGHIQAQGKGSGKARKR